MKKPKTIGNGLKITWNAIPVELPIIAHTFTLPAYKPQAIDIYINGVKTDTITGRRLTNVIKKGYFKIRHAAK